MTTANTSRCQSQTPSRSLVSAAMNPTLDPPEPLLAPYQSCLESPRHQMEVPSLPPTPTVTASSSCPVHRVSSTYTLPTSSILLLPKRRPGRNVWSSPIDPHPHTHFGNTIREKPKNGIRVFFQNVNGLSQSSDFADYKYYLSCLSAYDIDIAGLAETNIAWQHAHNQQDFRHIAHRQFRISKVTFGFPDAQVDPCSSNDSRQSGGTVSILQGAITSRIYGNNITDDTGLGRWTGVTLRGRDGYMISIITAYRTCGGNIKTSPLGSVFSREFLYFRGQGVLQPNPRRLFFQHLGTLIRSLQASGHQILLMLDANSDLSTDYSFSEFLSSSDLHDLHQSNSPPSTYIGSAHRRIDYMLGCSSLLKSSRRSGALSYFEGPQSDHRGLFADLVLPSLIHPSLCKEKMVPASQRILHTGNPELVSSYLTAIRQYYVQHRMFQRMEYLAQHHTTMGRNEVMQSLIQWDNDQGRAMACAESSISRPPKPYAWSPTLRNLAVIRRYWKLRLRELTHQHNYQTTFSRWQTQIQRYDPGFALPRLHDQLSIDEVRVCLNQATKQFRRAQLNSSALRILSYEDLIRSYNEDGNPSTRPESQRKAKQLLQTIRTETCRKFFGDLRSTFKPADFQRGLSSVLIPRPLNPTVTSSVNSSIYSLLRDTKPEALQWDTVITQADIERHLIAYNRDAFRAAASSPCGHGLIYNAITFTSLSSEAKSMLHGLVPSEWHNDDDILKEFLASFSIPDAVRATAPINTTLSESDVMRGFNGWRESTSTSPSGRHLGHYKALIQDPDLLTCFTQFLNIALFHGIALPRWCNATNVLIEKDAGRPCINRLRIIHLFEADFNFLLKIIWGSRLVQRAVEFNLLHDGQFGSVPRKTTMDPIMLTQLTTDLSRILKVNVARFDNDASACYDRIIVALGMMAARRCGMPDNAISTHASALQFMKYTVKTVYGVSIENYEGTPLEPLFGTGQGSGASPAVWLSLVVILLHTLERLVPDRTAFESPNKCLTHSRLVDAFVDDTSLGISDIDSEHTLEETVLRLQAVAQTWEKLLSLSGGALNLKKCSWYAVHWEWHNGRPVIRPIQPDDPQVLLTPSFGLSDPQVIPRMSVDQSSRILGVYLSPTGNFSDAINKYRVKADSFAARLKSPRIGHTEAVVFHRSIYIPSMRYGLAAISASEGDLSGIQTKVLASLLQKMNVSSTIPTSIRHGPIELGGLDLYDMRTELGIEQLKFLRNAIFSNSSAGRLILLNLQYLQLEAGIAEGLLANPGIEVSYLTPSWLVSVRDFLATHNMSITLTDQPTIQTAGPTDQFIMQSQHLRRYSKSQQMDINLVRIYLQVNTLADMTDELQPNRIRLEYLDGTRPHGWTTTMRWPKQLEPSKSQRRLWKRFIASSYLRYIPYWSQPPLSNTEFAGSAYKETLRSTPDYAHATTTPLSQYLSTLPRTQRRMVSDVEQVADDVQIWRAFRSKERLHLASDGGLMGRLGTFGWVLTTSKRVLFKCGGPVDGPHDTATSTRSELCGIASALLLIASVARNWGLRHRCSFRIITDSRSALAKIRHILKRHGLESRQPPESDLLMMIHSLLREIRRKVSFRWTKGHQDSIASYASLPRDARMNVDADFLATRYRLRGKLKSSSHIDHYPEQRISISIQGIRLTSQLDSCIRYHVNGYHLKQYMLERKGWNEDIWNSIDFGLFGQHTRSLSSSHRVLKMKMVHDQLPLGVRLHQRSLSKTESLKTCPCCRHSIEGNCHFWRCAANSFSANGLVNLRRASSGRQEDGLNPIRTLLVSGIEHWRATGSSNFRVDVNDYPSHMRDYVQNILRDQELIGWDNAIHGLLSKSWVDLASLDYCGSHRSPHDGARRMRECTKALFSFSQGLWKARNVALHESEEANRRDIRSGLADTITWLHNHPDQICFDDRYLVDMPLHKLLQCSASTQRRWIKRMQDSKALHTRRGERQTLITSFFRKTAS